MSKKQEFAFKNLGINRDLLFEQIEEVVYAIANVLECVENTVESITPANKIDIFDLLSLTEGLEMNKARFREVKQELRRTMSNEAGIYEELLYSAVKSISGLIKAVSTTVSTHNSIVTHYSVRDPPVMQEQVQEQDLEVVPRGRGRPSTKRRLTRVKPAVVADRVVLTADPITFNPREIKVNTLLRIAKHNIDRCQECDVGFIKTEEPEVVECPTCGAQELREDDERMSPIAETKHKRGGDQRFIELTQAIQGKLSIKDKDVELVEEAIIEARKAFPHGTEDYNDVNAWLRGSKVKTVSTPKGVKKYDSIYKYAPHIYSAVTGFELSSFTDREYAMIEKVYSYISTNFRELHCRLVSNQSTKSIKAEFFVDRLIDLYVTDVRRQRALKAVIARKTSESNAGNELIWKHVREEYIKA